MPVQDLTDILEAYAGEQRIPEISSALHHPKARIHLKGLIGSSDAMVAYTLFKKEQHTSVFVLSDQEEAVYFMNDLENLSGKPVLFFPASCKKPFDITLPDRNGVLQRTEVLNELKKSPAARLIITYPEAIAEKVINRETLDKNTLEIRTGDSLNVEFLIEFLTEYGFERVDFVYEAGQFSIRGGIADIFSFSHDVPYRIELFDDKVESIRTFDIADQLSMQNLAFITIVPNIQSAILRENNTSFTGFLPDDCLFWFKDAGFSFEVTDKGIKKAKELYQAIPGAEKQMNPEWMDPFFLYDQPAAVKEHTSAFRTLEFGKQFYYKPSTEVSFNMRPQPPFNKDFQLLQHNLEQNRRAGIHNLVFTDSPKQAERLYAIFEDLQKNQGETPHPAFTNIPLSIREGFIDQDLKIACYTDHQIFDRYYKYRLRKSYSKSQALTLKELRELKPGDFVTHIDHGIGKYAGLEKVESGGKVQEMIRLVYADNDLLYVNINSLNRISKYTGKEGSPPRLHKLGSDTWDKLKKRTKKKVKDIARDLIRLYAMRKAQQGFGFSPDSYLQTELEASFIYEDTPDQEKATADVKKDMESPHPMDRLICGDVGFGKTEVAVRAAFKAVADSKQAAVLVPTTILTLQHYHTFRERLKDFPCKVDYLNRFKTPAQIKDTLKQLAAGETDIVIGTHRLVSRDVKFKDLGLLIVDEEQKFGVSVKEKLKKLRVNVDTLTLTATPIPRTLHFSLMGARDLSIINTPPPNRQPVVTELHIFNETLVREAVEYETARGGQVFFIHNRIKDIHEIAGMIQRLCPDVKVCVGHGQMEGEKLERIMIDFIDGRYDVLVSTTIVESGLDVPNANTIFIHNAHHFGLSDLHQMRGRVGRSNKKAFCYLLSPPLSTLTPEARKRLSAIEEFTELGSGFSVAMRDLDIRGAGNLLGAEQSGFIAEIGFEMYHKILDEAVQELKEEEFRDLFKEEKPRAFVGFTQVDTDMNMHIPDAYVSSVSERYNLYNQLAEIEDEQALQDFAAKLADRFGPLPGEVNQLLDAMRLQWNAKEVGFEKISLKNGKLRGTFVSDPGSAYFESDQFMRVLRFVKDHPRRSHLKEGKKGLNLTVDAVENIPDAISLLNSMHEHVPV